MCNQDCNQGRNCTCFRESRPTTSNVKILSLILICVVLADIALVTLYAMLKS